MKENKKLEKNNISTITKTNFKTECFRITRKVYFSVFLLFAFCLQVYFLSLYNRMLEKKRNFPHFSPYLKRRLLYDPLL
jgi:hypothetical protein